MRSPIGSDGTPDESAICRHCRKRLYEHEPTEDITRGRKCPPAPVTYFAELNGAGYGVAEFTRLVLDATHRFGVTPEEMYSGSRSSSVANARHVVAYVARKKWGYSFPMLSRRLLWKDHTSGVSAVQRIEEEVKLQTALGKIASELLAELHGNASGEASISDVRYPSTGELEKDAT